MYGFRETYYQYNQHVNYMCRSMAAFLGLNDSSYYGFSATKYNPSGKAANKKLYPCGTFNTQGKFVKFQDFKWENYRMLQGSKVMSPSEFLDKLDSISMNMAKNQGLALNPSKINGACGRLMCCLTYENDNYIECRKQLPEVGKMVETEYGIGKVVSEDVLNLKYTVNINNELKEIKVADNGNRKE